MPAPSPGRKRVPRWRTMISPPVTTWPANTFTPRRLAFESRPLRLEPRPFLCAIGGRLLRGARLTLGLAADRGHPDAGELLAVAGAPLVAALWLELEHAQLGAAQVPSTSAWTTTPSRSPPSWGSPSPATSSGSRSIVAPSSADRRSTSRVVPSSTRYCLPPVLMTA